MRRRPVTGEGRILELSQCYLSSGEESRRLEEVAVASSLAMSASQSVRVAFSRGFCTLKPKVIEPYLPPWLP